MTLDKFTNSTQPYKAVDFNAFQVNDFLPAVKEAIDLSKNRIENIKSSERPNYQDSFEALAFCNLELNEVTSVFYNLLSAETNAELQKVAKEIAPLLSDYNNDIVLDCELYEVLKTVDLDEAKLSTEQSILAEKTLRRFERNGANLSDDKKEKLRNLDRELSQLKLTFSDNALAETNAYVLTVDDFERIKDLPDNVLETAKEKAEEIGKKEAWSFTLHFPSYVPFMTYCADRELRKEMAVAFGSRCNKDGEHDNREIITKIASLRHDRAQLLGYKNHADYVLEERMAKDEKTVVEFLDDLLESALPSAQNDIDDLANLATELDGIDKIERHDIAYYAEKLKKRQLDIDDQALKPYFELESTLKGLFDIASSLYGIHLKIREDISTYHEDVRTYEVLDENEQFVSLLYVDLFPRPGKRAGAWMTSFKDAYFLDGKEHRPHISIVCNFTRPGKSSPSLLTFTEVTTLFHEFGHALHGMLGKGTYPSLTGTNVSWDFVELPSQIMENWCYEKESLDRFAKHYKTGETIPVKWLEKLKESLTFQEGYKTLRQLSFGYLDMSWHTNKYSGQEVSAFEKEAMGKAHIMNALPGTCQSTAFAHIFSGGYSAGYYSYKWAEVLDADAFDLFQKTGIFNSKTSTAFKTHILERGGTEKPEKLYEAFRGRKPNAEALKRRAGFSVN